jgi:Uma2 family endonuclease
MNTTCTHQNLSRLVINIQPLHITDEEFFELCAVNDTLRFERTAQGEMIVMTPAGGETGSRNFDIALQLGNWNKRMGLGKAFDSSTGFKLPNGAERSPDLSWVLQERWEKLSAQERERFPPLCPDFVMELRSPSDNLKDVQEKMQEYLANGARLGWLIDPKTKRVEIYRPGQQVEVLENPATVSGEAVLPGFELDLSDVW